MYAHPTQSRRFNQAFVMRVTPEQGSRIHQNTKLANELLEGSRASLERFPLPDKLPSFEVFLPLLAGLSRS
jgi:hypothetical protein